MTKKSLWVSSLDGGSFRVSQEQICVTVIESTLFGVSPFVLYPLSRVYDLSLSRPISRTETVHGQCTKHQSIEGIRSQGNIHVTLIIVLDQVSPQQLFVWYSLGTFCTLYFIY